MSKFLSGRQSNLKLGVAGYTENKTVLETTGKVGIGTTDAQSYSLFVVGDTNVTGLVSATAFYGDGSNLENTGATLSAAAGTQRLVVTSLTSGTMVDAATDSDLTYNATTDTLNVENIDVDGHTELDQLRVTGVSTFAGNVDISSNGNLTVAGNLIVQGTETRLNTTVLEVEDINIGIASVTPTLSDAALDGAGITIHGSQGDKTLTWSNANSRMEFNTDVNVANLELDDNQKAKFGTSDDLEIYHNANNSHVDNKTGDLYIKNFATDADVIIQTDDGSGGETDYIMCDGSTGSVKLNYYGTKKLETTDGGIDVTGHTETDTLRVSGISTFNGQINLNAHLDMGTNDFIKVGDGDELLIYFDSLDTQILNTGGGYLNITNSNERVNIRAVYNEDGIVVKPNGSVELYYDNSKKFETTSYGAKIYNDLQVGTGVTIYGNAGIVSATSFYGDGSNLTNTGATLSATSGVERLVTTQLTSGTMVDAATDADLTFNAGTNTLNTENIKISGGISTDGSDYGNPFQLLRADGNGKWEWATVPGIFSVNNILNGFNVLEEGSTVGTAGSIHTLDFRGINVTATGDPQPNGIATITFSSTPTFTDLTVLNNTTIPNVIGITTFSNNVHVGSGITMYAATGIVSATKLYGDGSDLTGINAGAILGISSGTQRLVMTSLTSGAMLNAATDADLTFNAADNLLSVPNFEINGGTISVGGTTGTNNQYLKSTGVGVTWADFPTLRTSHTENANAGVTTFNFSYNVNFLDVFVNGVKLTLTEYSASDGSTVTLETPTFQDDIVELVSYNTVSTFAGAGSSTGVSDGDKGDIIVSGSGTNWQIDANTIGSNELVNTSVTPGTYNLATLTVDADGRLTAASSGTESFTAVGIQSAGTLVGAAKTLNFIGAGNTFAVNGDTIDISIAGGGGGASVEVSDTAPSSPSEGDLWWRSTDGKGFIYYNDGNSNQWVEFNPSATGIAGINTTGFSYFTSIVTNALTATGTITANTFVGITTSMISDYGNGLDSGANVAISTNAPSSPEEGDLWWDSDTGKGYIYYSDVDSNQWVEFNPAGSAGSGGGGGSLNDLVDDLTPQLGGNLDLNNKNIVGTGNIPAGNLTGSLPALDGSALTGIGTVVISDNAPSSPDVGQLWWESDTATGHIYYNDGNTSQWVQFNGGAGSGGGSSYSNSNVDTHLNTSSATSGQVLSWNGSDYAWVADQTGGSGIGTSRFAVSNTTGSIGAGTTADITISGAKAYSLFKVETSHAAWVRLYTDTTSRTNDASRAHTTDPTPGSGVLAEVYTTTSGSNTFKMTPAVTGWNDDATPSTNIYAKVTNNESTSQDITVTLTILRMED